MGLGSSSKRPVVSGTTPARFIVSMLRKITWKTIIGLGILSSVLCCSVRSDVRIFFVITGSMGPVIPANSFVISKKISAHDVKPGLVIIFSDQNNNRITAHRVVEIQDGRYVTKGDKNTSSDRYLVRSGDVLGQVVGVFPTIDPLYLGTHLLFLVLMLALGVLLKRFLLCLRHGVSCPTTAHGAFYKFYIFRRAKKAVCGGQTPLSPG